MRSPYGINRELARAREAERIRLCRYHVEWERVHVHEDTVHRDTVAVYAGGSWFLALFWLLVSDLRARSHDSVTLRH